MKSNNNQERNRYADKIATSCGYPDEQNHITVKKIIDTQIRQQDMAVTQMIKFKGGRKGKLLQIKVEESDG